MVRANKIYYVVFRGRVPGIYISWPICHSQVNEFSGNLHKSYDTFDEARMAFEQFLYAGRLQNQLTDNGPLLHQNQPPTIQQNPSPIVDQILPLEKGIQGHRPKEHGDNHPILRQNNRFNQMQRNKFPTRVFYLSSLRTWSFT
ncbi:hypothetical protein S83_019186 [Arachis hypogaea]